MTADQQPAVVDRDETPFAFVLEAVRRDWKRMIATTGIFASLGLGAAWMVSPAYNAWMVVSPNPDTGAASGLSTLISQTLGSASSSTGENADRWGQIYYCLHSEQLAKTIYSREYFLTGLYPSGRDGVNHKWRGRSGLLSPLYLVLDAAKITHWPPTADDVQNGLENNLLATTLPNTTAWTISYQNRSGPFAKNFMSFAYDYCTESVRQATVNGLDRNIAYLESQLNKITVADLRSSLIAVTTDSIKQRVLANENSNFAARTLDPPVVDSAPAYPKPTIFIAIGMVLGLFLGTLVALRRLVLLRRGVDLSTQALGARLRLYLTGTYRRFRSDA